MSVMQSASSGCRILAVAVLYKQAPAESHAVSSFLKNLRDHPLAGGSFSLLIYDNSPQPQNPVMRADFPIHYMHDPSNGGLAAAYNYALARAEQAGFEWLLVLDQDTTLTRDFFSELLACANSLQPQDNVAAIVPKLMVGGAIVSPAEHFIDYMRHQFRRSILTLGEDDVGVQHERISAYNSACTLNVAVLRSIGGFPKEFWLDYLDHAVFHALYAKGRTVHVLRAVLKHDLAESDLNARPLWRFRNALKAQTLFVKRAGNLGDRLLYRFWLLRSIRRLRADCLDKRIWRETAMQALLFRAPNSSAPVPPPAITTPNPP